MKLMESKEIVFRSLGGKSGHPCEGIKPSRKQFGACSGFYSQKNSTGKLWLPTTEYRGGGRQRYF